MKKLPVSELPVHTFYWRKGDSNRWSKVLTDHAISFAMSSQTSPIDNLDEIGLSDPNWCSECWRELTWLEFMVCPYCGAHHGDSIEDIKRQIENWTGFPSPHL